MTLLPTVAAPKGCLIYDCRMPEERLFERDADGRVLLGSERVERLLGVRCTRPRGGQVYHDLRAATVAELASYVAEAVEGWKEVRAEYLRAKRNPSTDGGGVYYRPIAVAICNYGWSVLADESDFAVMVSR